MEKTITFLMLEHHTRLNNTLKDLEDGFGMNNSDIVNAWKKFKQAIEAHMKLEEQVIFSFSDLGTSEAQLTIRELLTEHGQLRQMIVNIDENFDVNIGMNISDLRKYLFDHEAKENQVLYPKLDLELDEHGRKFILEKISKF